MPARLARQAVRATQTAATSLHTRRHCLPRHFTTTTRSHSDGVSSGNGSTNANAKKAPFIHRFLHGNQEAKEEIEQAVQERETNFSQKIARGKYVHEFMVHDVKPDCVDKYLELM